MGQMRFWAAMGEHLPEKALDRAYLAGLDGIPWRSRNSFHDGILTLDRGTHESGCLVIPWRTSRGLLALSTGSLMERDKAYHLAVELARGTLHRVHEELAEFAKAGFAPSESVAIPLAIARAAFVRVLAMRGEPAEITALAVESIEASLALVGPLAAERTRAMIESRLRQAPQLPTLLAGTLSSPLSSAAHESAFLDAFNGVSISVMWRDLAENEGQTQWDDLDRRASWCQRAGLRVCMGPLLQLDRVAVPDWLYLWEDDFEQLCGCASDFLRSVVRRYIGKVHIWHVAARLNVGGELALSEENRLRLAVTGIDTIRKEDPATPVVISFDQPWGEYLAHEPHELSSLHFADALARADLGLAGLGLEINLGYWPDGTYPRDLLEIGRHVDRWGMLGLPLLIALTIPSDDRDDDRSWNRHATVAADKGRTTPESQRALCQDLLPMLVSKPMVHGVVWNQQTDARPHAFAHGGLWDRAEQPKPVLPTITTVRKQLLT